MFASQLWGIEPDIMAFAKGIGGGLPLGGFIATDEVASTFEEGDHFSTFGGNPVSCAAAVATLEVIKEERLEENARKVGDHTMRALKEIGEKRPLIGEVRGKGLMIGVELVKDSKKTPAVKEAARVKTLMKEKGFLIGVGGLYGNVLRLEPPLIISKREIDFGIAAMESAISEAGR
jgi:4-aminobutyrate aminotransferase-like enzyme